MDSSEFLLPLHLTDLSSEIKTEYCTELVDLLLRRRQATFLDFRDRHVPPSTIKDFETLGLTPCLRKTLLFTSAPLNVGEIHLDGDPTNPEKFRPFAINWVWGGKTVMQWFDSVVETPAYTQWTEHIYTEFTEQQTVFAHQSTLTGATLVNISKPHRVINASKERRFCFSMCSEEHLTWTEMTDLCRKHGLVRE